MSTDCDASVSLGAFLRAERRQARINQTHLAKRLGVAQSVVSRIETGYRQCDMREFIAIAAALHIEPLELFRRLLCAVSTTAPLVFQDFPQTIRPLLRRGQFEGALCWTARSASVDRTAQACLETFGFIARGRQWIRLDASPTRSDLLAANSASSLGDPP